MVMQWYFYRYRRLKAFKPFLKTVASIRCLRIAKAIHLSKMWNLNLDSSANLVTPPLDSEAYFQLGRNLTGLFRRRFSDLCQILSGHLFCAHLSSSLHGGGEWRRLIL